MSTPIKPSGIGSVNGITASAAVNSLNGSNGQGGTAALQDLMSRLGAQGAGQGSQQAFSQWLNQHAAAHDEPAAQPKPASPARPAAPPRPTQVANPATTRLSTEQLQAMQSQARLVQQAQQAQQANRPDKTAPKPQAKPAAKEGAPRADEAQADDRADEADQTDTAPAADAAAVVRELTPPAHVQAHDTAGMMAWLAQLSQSEALQGQEGDAALDAGSGGVTGQGGQNGLGGDGASQPGRGALDPAQLSATISLDSPAWRSASGSASLQAEVMLAPVGASGEGRADTTAFASLLSGGLQGPAGGAQRSGEASALRHERATLETPFGGTDFAQALAEKVSMWVSTAPTDGPMTAELHLNPAEMGPINVKISLDGQSAQVDFAAAALETRQAIEASMPLLSTALDSIGLSLSGSDVSSQTPQQQSFAQQMAREAERTQGRAGRERGDSDAQPLDTGLRPVRAPRPGRLGGLDLYA
jgi:flagellar hook-length control protein FliK